MTVHLVVGLGNPGAAYATTRHNVGFRVVDELCRRNDVRWRSGRLFELATFHRADSLRLAKPLTYMNRSGAAVEALLEELALGVDEVLLVVDDVDLPLGRLRLRASGGPGTHNGLRDICERLGEGFPRLRVGVRGDQEWGDLADFVLSPFENDEIEAAEQTVRRAADAVDAVIDDGMKVAMDRFNRRPPEQS